MRWGHAGRSQPCALAARGQPHRPRRPRSGSARPWELPSCPPFPGSRHGALHCGRRFLGSAATPTAREPGQGGGPPPAGAQRPRVSPRQPPPSLAVTFHFGEGKDRTVAGAERGHPGRVLLHDEPSACRSASADRLHPGAGRGAPLGSGPVASAAEERERLAAQALPPGLPAGLLLPRGSLRRPLRAHLPWPRSHSTHAPTAPAWRLLQTPTSRTSALPTPTPRAHLLRPPSWDAQPCSPGPPSRPCPGCGLGPAAGLASGSPSALFRHQLMGGETPELSLSVSRV